MNPDFPLLLKNLNWKSWALQPEMTKKCFVCTRRGHAGTNVTIWRVGEGGCRAGHPICSGLLGQGAQTWSSALLLTNWWPWASPLPSLHFSFMVIKTEISVITYKMIGNIKWFNTHRACNACPFASICHYYYYFHLTDREIGS